MPKRIQLSRRAGWRKPPGVVNVARPTKWGNPFRVGGWFRIGDPDPKARFKMSWCEASPDPSVSKEGFTLIEDNAMAVEFFKRLMASGYHKDLSELRGRDLGCWCKIGMPCHADVYLELANK